MMSGPDMKSLCERILKDDELKLGHPAKILARTILSMDDPSHFIRNISDGDYAAKPGSRFRSLMIEKREDQFGMSQGEDCADLLLPVHVLRPFV